MRIEFSVAMPTRRGGEYNPRVKRCPVTLIPNGEERASRRRRTECITDTSRLILGSSGAPSHLSSLPSYCIRNGAAVPVGPSEVQSPTGELTPGDGQTFVNHLERPSGTHHGGTTGTCHKIPPADHFPRRSSSSPVAPPTLRTRILNLLGINKRDPRREGEGS